MIQLGIDEKIFSPRIDLVFKSMFTQDTPESKGALIDFLESIIGKKIFDVAIQENELAVTGILEKQSTMDLNCKFNNGDQANIEIQVRNRGNMGIRAEYHVCKLHSGQAIKGETYDDLHLTYQITIADYTVFPGDDLFFEEFEYRGKSGRVLNGGRTRIYFIELTKLQKLLQKPAEDLTKPEMWALYFKYVDDTKKRPMINKMIQEEEGLAMASSMLQKLAQDDAMRVTLLSIEKAELDRTDLIVHARRDGYHEGLQKGIEKGIEKGMKKERLDMIKAMHESGIPIDTIAKVTNMTIEDLQNLLQQ